MKISERMCKMYFSFLKMSDSITGSGGNSTSSVKSFFKDVGSATVKFGNHLVMCVTYVYKYTIGKIVYRFSEDARSLKEHKASIENDKKPEILINEMGKNKIDTKYSRFENAINLYKRTFEYRSYIPKREYRSYILKRNLKLFFINDTVSLLQNGFHLFVIGAGRDEKLNVLSVSGLHIG